MSYFDAYPVVGRSITFRIADEGMLPKLILQLAGVDVVQFFVYRGEFFRIQYPKYFPLGYEPIINAVIDDQLHTCASLSFRLAIQYCYRYRQINGNEYQKQEYEKFFQHCPFNISQIWGA